jgi:hypothetical protein
MLADTRRPDADTRASTRLTQQPARRGFANLYASRAAGISYNVNELWQVRPEVGNYRGHDQRAFDDGSAMGEWIVGMDTTLRF